MRFCAQRGAHRKHALSCVFPHLLRSARGFRAAYSMYVWQRKFKSLAIWSRSISLVRLSPQTDLDSGAERDSAVRRLQPS